MSKMEIEELLQILGDLQAHLANGVSQIHRGETARDALDEVFQGMHTLYSALHSIRKAGGVGAVEQLKLVRQVVAYETDKRDSLTP